MISVMINQEDVNSKAQIWVGIDINHRKLYKEDSDYVMFFCSFINLYILEICEFFL